MIRAAINARDFALTVLVFGMPWWLPHLVVEMVR
jgi:hypothetical protein